MGYDLMDGCSHQFSYRWPLMGKGTSGAVPIVICLDAVMEARGMSLGELARRVGRTDVNLSRIKTGKILSIRFSTLAPICEVLECQPGDIMKYLPDEEYTQLQDSRADEEAPS